MPTKKKTTLAETLGAAPPAPDETSKTSTKVVQPKTVKNPNKTGVSDVAGRAEKNEVETRPAPTTVELSAGQAQVVATLCGQGYSYAEAVAMLSGSSNPNPKAQPSEPALTAEDRERIRKLSEGDDSDLPEVEDVPEKFALVDFSMEKRDGFKCLLDDLWTRREEIEDLPKKTKFRVTFLIDQPELDWLLHRTIQEGQQRKDADYSVQRALMLLLKQQKALDSTRGGKRSFGSSGPKENYNPVTGGWTK